VIQFNCDSIDIAYAVWHKMCDKMKEEQFTPFAPPFTGISFITGAGPYEGTTWVELSVARGEKNSPIMKVHYAALEVLKLFNLQPLNGSDNNYRPHLTLARIAMPTQMPVWNAHLLESFSDFRLEFGLSDEKWQYVKPLGIFSHNIKKHADEH
jgi:hypothetical protein